MVQDVFTNDVLLDLTGDTGDRDGSVVLWKMDITLLVLSAFLNAFLHVFWKALKELHWLDFWYSLDIRRTIFFRLLLYKGRDFLFLQTLVGISLSMDCSTPVLKVSHKSSIVEDAGVLVISLES